MSDLTKISLLAGAATFFLDLLDLSFGRILFFITTLRFWLYFILHLFITAVACWLVYQGTRQWVIVALAGSFLGVAVLSNSDIKIAGTSVVPIATLFTNIKAQMVAQAAEEKAERIEISLLTERLRRLQIDALEKHCQSALAGRRDWTVPRIQRVCEEAKKMGTNRDLALARLMLDNNFEYVKEHITTWENHHAAGAPIPPDEPKLPRSP